MSHAEAHAVRQSISICTPAATDEELGFTITLRAGEQSRTMDFGQAFALAHRLAKQMSFVAAAAICEQLAKVKTSGPAAHIMLAICEAALARYSTCLKVLNRAPAFNPAIAAETYDIILQTRMGCLAEAIHALTKLANTRRDIPMFCLWLGDLYEASHAPKKAIQCWKVAVTRDRAHGAVGIAAKTGMVHLAKADRSRPYDTAELSVGAP